MVMMMILVINTKYENMTAIMFLIISIAYGIDRLNMVIMLMMNHPLRSS